MPKSLIFLITLVLVLQACSYPELIPLPAPVIEPTTLPTFAIPSPTQTPTVQPAPTSSPTPTTPLAFPKDETVNCRYGPDTKWAVASSLLADNQAEIIGKNADLSWWLINDPFNPGSECWVSMSVTNTAGNIGLVEIVPPPTAKVTDVSVDAEVTFTACGGPNSIKSVGTIRTNGPTAVTYQWELGGDAEVTTPPETINFTEAGLKELSAEVFTADCGNYFLVLRVNSPNSTFARHDVSVQSP